MNYTIRLVDDKTIVFDFLPKNVALSLFLQGDFTAFQEDFLRLIDNVLEGDASEEEFSGNATSVLFKKDMTTIEDLYLEGVPAECQIPTMELRSLMDEWMKKRKEFIESKKKEDS